MIQADYFLFWLLFLLLVCIYTPLVSLNPFHQVLQQTNIDFTHLKTQTS